MKSLLLEKRAEYMQKVEELEKELEKANYKVEVIDEFLDELDYKELLKEVNDDELLNGLEEEESLKEEESLEDLEKFGMAQIFTGTDTIDKNKAKYLDTLILEVLGL